MTPLAPTDLRSLADALEALAVLRQNGVRPGNHYEGDRISHGDNAFDLSWNDEDGYAIIGVA